MVMSPQWSLETKSLFSTIRGDSRESNPGPRPPEGRIMPLDHYPTMIQRCISAFYKVAQITAQNRYMKYSPRKVRCCALSPLL